VAGVELGGAVKNIIAIAAGISDGLGFGLNARAALVTRGLANSPAWPEPRREARDLHGASGMGDLILTCTGDLSRNANWASAWPPAKAWKGRCANSAMSPKA